jgi:DNA-binding IclR family transcriptional regulator
MIGILDVFDAGDDAATITFEDLCARLGYTRSTLYRYLKTLTDAGLLTSLPSVGYMLGPRIVELDYKIRTGDVLIRAARPMMEELSAKFGAVALLCRRYRFDVLCVHQETGPEAIHSNYDRGRSRSLLQGAASIAILVYLPEHQLRKFHGMAGAAFSEAGFGATLKEVKETLKRHRERGWVMTAGDVTPGAVGIAAPVFDARAEIIGSLSLTMRDTQMKGMASEDIAERLVFCASVLSKTLARS